jgi:hypothetical protein
MKKYYFLLAFFGLLAGYSAESDNWFEDEKDVYFPITREQLKVKRTQVAGLTDLSALSQSELLYEVYNRKVLLDSAKQNDYFAMIRKRITSDYPAKTAHHSKIFDREVKARLGLLQAMAAFWHPKNSDVRVNPSELRNFFAQVAKSNQENLMVRRQAYKNWLSIQDPPTQSSHSRLATLATHSDENLIGSLAQDTQ